MLGISSLFRFFLSPFLSRHAKLLGAAIDVSLGCTASAFPLPDADRLWISQHREKALLLSAWKLDGG